MAHVTPDEGENDKSEPGSELASTDRKCPEDHAKSGDGVDRDSEHGGKVVTGARTPLNTAQSALPQCLRNNGRGGGHRNPVGSRSADESHPRCADDRCGRQLRRSSDLREGNLDLAMAHELK